MIWPVDQNGIYSFFPFVMFIVSFIKVIDIGSRAFLYGV